jgi:hypothetical protein
MNCLFSIPTPYTHSPPIFFEAHNQQTLGVSRGCYRFIRLLRFLKFVPFLEFQFHVSKMIVTSSTSSIILRIREIWHSAWTWKILRRLSNSMASDSQFSGPSDLFTFTRVQVLVLTDGARGDGVYLLILGNCQEQGQH